MSIFTLMKHAYHTIARPGESVIRDRGSRFLGFVFPVNNLNTIHEILDQYRKSHHDARHHCYAYRLGLEGEEWRANDDGEPSGSAGKPIHGQLLSQEITNVLALVIRYFGGVKLGVPGLINAYRSATRDAIDDTTIVKKLTKTDLTIRFEYPVMNKVMKMIKEEDEIEMVTNHFDLKCEIQCKVPTGIKDKMNRGLEGQAELIWAVGEP